MKTKICFWIGNCIYILLAILLIVCYGIFSADNGGLLDSGALVMDLFLISFCLHFGFYLNDTQGKCKTFVGLVVCYILLAAGIVVLDYTRNNSDLFTGIVLALAIPLGFFLSFSCLYFLGCSKYVFTPLLSWAIGTVGLVIYIVHAVLMGIQGAREENFITRAVKNHDANMERERLAKTCEIHVNGYTRTLTYLGGTGNGCDRYKDDIGGYWLTKDGTNFYPDN